MLGLSITRVLSVNSFGFNPLKVRLKQFVQLPRYFSTFGCSKTAVHCLETNPSYPARPSSLGMSSSEHPPTYPLS
jgi:hypothetical protein